MALNAREQRGAPHDHAGLRPAEQFVGGKADDISACGEAFSRRRLVRQTPAFGVEWRAAAEVVDVQDARSVRGGGEARKRGRFSETDDTKVAWMHAENRR